MYRNAYWSNKDRCIKLRSWNKEGKRITIDVPFRPYLYVESPKGNYLSIFENRLEKKEFNTPFERVQFTRSYGTDRYYENFDPAHQFLLDTFWNYAGNDNFSSEPLRIIFWDIEVDPLPNNEFPDAERARAEINIITAYDSLDKKYYVFSKYDYAGNNLGDDVVFKNCGSEKNLIADFFAFIRSNDYPDVLTGWNSGNYDIPYLKHRVERLFGPDYWLTISPYGEVRSVATKDKMLRDVVKEEIAGYDNLDMLEVYMKYKVVKQESYRLDFIAQQEIGYGKVDYEGMTIGEFMTKKWDRFVEYNVRDVELLVKMEEKLRYFQILRAICNMALCNYSKGLMTIPVTNGAVALRARQRNRALHTFVRHEETGDKPGGFVASNAGVHKYVISYDASSLYPNLIRTLNISPETKIGMCYFKNDATVANYQDFDNEVKLVATSGKVYNLSTQELHKLIKDKNLCIAFNGCLFRQDKEGILPQFMREVFTARTNTKNKIKSINQHNEKLELELEKLKTQLSLL